MEQGLANELVGRAKGTLRKVANLATTPQPRGLFWAPQVEYGASIAQPQMVEKRRDAILSRVLAPRGLSPEDGCPHDAALHTCFGHPFRMKIVPVDESSGTRASKSRIFWWKSTAERARWASCETPPAPTACCIHAHGVAER